MHCVNDVHVIYYYYFFLYFYLRFLNPSIVNVNRYYKDYEILVLLMLLMRNLENKFTINIFAYEKIGSHAMWIPIYPIAKKSLGFFCEHWTHARKQLFH